jgi:gluconolactonase
MATTEGEGAHMISRREVIHRLGAAAGVAAFVPRAAGAQAPAVAARGNPPTVISNPPRDFTPGAQPVTYPDPDIITIDPSFNTLRLGNTPIQRLWTGGLWCEGPAWCSQGRYLVWSDIPNNRQLRWLEDDGRVTVFRQPAGNSNGNTFDFQGRQISCEHSGRRVVRYEHDGAITILADSWDGKRLNSPNDLAPHRDGSIWFTDPPFGGSVYEGMPDAAGGPSNPQGLLNARAGQPAGSGTLKRELPTNVYRIDPSGRVDLVITEQQMGGGGNGICFSPDYKKLYVVSRGVQVFDITADNKLTNQKTFADFMVDGVRCGPDGIRTDVYGNVWAPSNAGANLGYSGVTVWSTDAKLLGRIRLPEVCANVTFGGPKRNRLFMAAGQSLYAVYTNTQGSSPG